MERGVGGLSAAWAARNKRTAERWGNRIALMQLMLSESAPLSIGAGGLVVLRFATTVASIVATGVVIGTIPSAIGGGFSSQPGRLLVAGLIALASLEIVGALIDPLRAFVAEAVGQRVQARMRSRVMATVLAPIGVAHLEDASTLDLIQQAAGVGGLTAYSVNGAVSGLLGIANRWAGGIAAFTVVGYFYWWIGLLVAATWIVLIGLFRDYAFKVVMSLTRQSGELRRADYFRDAGVSPPAGKELRVYGLQGWVGERFHTQWIDSMAGVWKQRFSLISVLPWSVPVVIGVHAIAFLYIGNQALTGHIDLRGFTTAMFAVLGIINLASFTQDDQNLEFGGAAVGKALELEKKLRAPIQTSRQSAEGLPSREIRLQGIHFRYPGRAEDLYRGIDLRIPAGRSLAIVGANGAGKTTLVKLLARLYEPTAGTIEVDGRDLRDIDPVAWQRRIAPIFQDFNRYGLSLRENVAFGAIGCEGSDELVGAALAQAGAGGLADELKFGIDTVLSKEFKDGADLSGGQWQKVALARALFALKAGAAILILDEPTASLDVRAEAELFDRYLELTRGVTTILISHRFSTVRHADRIAVIDGGVIVEEGSHAELIAAGGRYAQMFNLQAARFAEAGAL